jgi:BlaI family transcriptional regulator, penicillinase repressor
MRAKHQCPAVRVCPWQPINVRHVLWDDLLRFLPLTYDLLRSTLFDMTSPRRNQPPITLPTAAELDILAVLWRLGMATVREVHDDLGKDNRYTTTLKTMQLMTEKGLLIRGERFGAHVYEASVPKEQTQRQIAGDLLKRVFGGSSRSLVIGALAAQPVSRKELDEIRDMLDIFAREKEGSE